MFKEIQKLHEKLDLTTEQTAYIIEIRDCYEMEKATLTEREEAKLNKIIVDTPTNREIKETIRFYLERDLDDLLLKYAKKELDYLKELDNKNI